MYAIIPTGRAPRGEKALVSKFRRKKHTPERAAAAPRATSGDRGLGGGEGDPLWGPPVKLRNKAKQVI